MGRRDKRAARFGGAYAERFRHSKPRTLTVTLTADVRPFLQALRRAIMATGRWPLVARGFASGGVIRGGGRHP